MKSLEIKGLDKGFLGFSNSRMAYDDVLSRTALAIERRSLTEKITSGDLTELYRKDSALRADTMELIGAAISLLATSTRRESLTAKFNKATAFSWLIFLVRAKLHNYSPLSNRELSGFLSFFEETRGKAVHGANSMRLLANCAPVGRLFSIYESRSSARVADVSSVMLRDAIIWLAFEDFSIRRESGSALNGIGISKIHSSFDSQDTGTEGELLAKRLIESGWGELA